MPIPRDWSKELVVEWLSLGGYLTEVGIPVATGSLPRQVSVGDLQNLRPLGIIPRI